MKYDHDIIRDLMPLCIDGIASEKSREAVEKHITECSDCKKEWEQMKKNINPCEYVPLLDDTVKYKETAKRIRKRNRWILLKVTCATLIAVFILGIIGNYIDGARFTPKGSAKAEIKEVLLDTYETPEQAQNASKPDITFLGTIKSPDKKAAATYALIYQPDKNETFFVSCDSDRSDLLRMGMWIGCGWSLDELNKDIGITMNGGAFDYENGAKWFGSVAFCITDENIKKISFTMNEQTYELTPDEKGFCGIGYDVYNQNRQYVGLPFNGKISEGTATDENGSVLYSIQQITENFAGEDITYYDWVKS